MLVNTNSWLVNHMAASHFGSSGRNEKEKGNEATLNVVIMAVAVVVVAASRVWSEYLRNCRPPGNWEHHYHLLGLQRMVPKIEKFPSARTHYWHTVAHRVFINQRQFHFCWSTSWISGVLHSFSALFFFQRFPATVWFVGSDVWTRPLLDAPLWSFATGFERGKEDLLPLPLKEDSHSISKSKVGNQSPCWGGQLTRAWWA